MKDSTDEKLLADFLLGEQGSFDVLVYRHNEELRQFALKFTKNAANADDVIQETFLKVFQSAESFDPTRRFKPWLYTIAANKARDFLRSRQRKREVSIEATVSNDGEGEQRFIDLMSDRAFSPHEQLSMAETQQALDDIVNDMPPKLNEVFVLAKYHQFAYQEIAEILEIPVGTVKSRLNAAMVRCLERFNAGVEQTGQNRRK